MATDFLAAETAGQGMRQPDRFLSVCSDTDATDHGGSSRARMAPVDRQVTPGLLALHFDSAFQAGSLAARVSWQERLARIGRDGHGPADVVEKVGVKLFTRFSRVALPPTKTNEWLLCRSERSQFSPAARQTHFNPVARKGGGGDAR